MNARKFRQVSSFSADDGAELERQLSQFETNVSDAFAGLGSAFPLHLRVRKVETAACSALPWDMLPVDPSGGDISVRLPPGSQKFAGAWVVILRRSTAHAVTAVPTGNYVNGSASVTLAAAKKAFPFFCDGVDWWSV